MHLTSSYFSSPLQYIEKTNVKSSSLLLRNDHHHNFFSKKKKNTFKRSQLRKLAQLRKLVALHWFWKFRNSIILTETIIDWLHNYWLKLGPLVKQWSIKWWFGIVTLCIWLLDSSELLTDNTHRFHLRQSNF